MTKTHSARSWWWRSQYLGILVFLGASIGLLTASATAWAESAQYGQACGPGKKCGAGLSCHPFIQKCYNSPRQRGEPCSAGFECGSGLTCQAGSQTCVGPGRAGDACHLTAPCDTGLTCEAGTQKCTGPRQAGEACHLTAPCASGLSCEAGSQRCAAPRKFGESCHATAPCQSDLTCMPGSQKCSWGAKPVSFPGDFPPPAAAKSAADRQAECAASKDVKCNVKIEIPRSGNIPTNCIYGWAMGKGHPASATNPPDYSKLLNALDQCSFFHDRGAWGYNRNTKVCENWAMCSNSMGLMRCLERFDAITDDEKAAKACFIDHFREPMKSCVKELYPDWGAEYAKAPSGEQWLSAKSISELRGAMLECPNEMANPGFPMNASELPRTGSASSGRPLPGALPGGIAMPPLAVVPADYLVGEYENQAHDGKGKNDWHYVRITKIDATRVKWTNRANVSWTLTINPNDRNRVMVGEDSPYFKQGYRWAELKWQTMRNQPLVVSIEGPGKEFYQRK